VRGPPAWIIDCFELFYFGGFMKVCNKCGINKSLEDFHRDSGKQDGRTGRCKDCCKVQRIIKYKENREEILVRTKEYKLKNSEAIKVKNKIYRERNIETIKAYSQIYRENNKEVMKSYKKKYYSENREKLLEVKRAYSARVCDSLERFNKLILTDEAWYIDGKVVVICKLCGEKFNPFNWQVANRLSSINGTLTGEHNFYCSDSCKDACPVYRFQPKCVDPRSNLYITKLDIVEARACQTDHLKQLQCDEYGHNFCEKCGDIIDVELHHTLPVSKHGREAINSSGHILLCAGCHSDLHSECV
jgi:hypothetical protein